MEKMYWQILRMSLVNFYNHIFHQISFFSLFDMKDEFERCYATEGQYLVCLTVALINN